MAAGISRIEDWPDHADRTRQQVYIEWLREAHERGRRDLRNSSNLNLVVVSLVNNDVLCEALKAIDPRGNVPECNSAGDIVGWKSGQLGLLGRRERQAAARRRACPRTQIPPGTGWP